MSDHTLPIESVLPELGVALRARNMAVLQAPPGAGKTTRVPLFLLEQNLTSGKILMLEPRRLAARAAAERMAQTLGEKCGQTIGYRMRGDNKTSATTQVEVITEGILTRQIQNDPELNGVSCIIFDEFHERSLQGDLGIAFALEIRGALRPDLMLIAMSATLDAAPVAELMGNAPIITSQGRSFPVEPRHLNQSWARPNQRGVQFETASAALIEHAAAETAGGILAFLPGEGEIRRTAALLADRLPPDTHIRPLFSALPFADQRSAIAPEKSGRKLVLATSIAETSLTIQDIRVVVDCGRARRARFDAGSGMSRLITERVTRAEAIQRAGRAGRIAPGIAYKLWTKGEEGGFAPFPVPEIQSADLTSLVLELAAWGATTPDGLPFLTQPRETDFTHAQSLLRDLGALDTNNQITPHGRAIAKHPVHARLGHVLERGGDGAALFAAILENRDPLARSAPKDLDLRFQALRNPKKFKSEHGLTVNPATKATILADAKRLHDPNRPPFTTAEMAALAYPDRIAQRRDTKEHRFLLSGGKGAVIDDPALGPLPFLVATDTDGAGRDMKIRMATPITQTQIESLYGDQITIHTLCNWDKRHRRVNAIRQTRFGALVLQSENWKTAEIESINNAMITGIRDLGLQILPWTKPATYFIARINWLRERGTNLPDCTVSTLLETLETWLAPYLNGARTPNDLNQLNMTDIAQNLLDYAQVQLLNQLAPAKITAPTGTSLPIDYTHDQPKISVRLQELFGLTKHPTVGPDRLPLLIELLSPARRPVQTTADLPGFWASSYDDVRKDMRGRYPKHPWPDDPTQAEPTRRVKPRK